MEKFLKIKKLLRVISQVKLKVWLHMHCKWFANFYAGLTNRCKASKKIDHLMNVPVKVIATRIDRSRGNVCTSRRAVLEKDKNAEVKEMLKNIKEGDICK